MAIFTSSPARPPPRLTDPPPLLLGRVRVRLSSPFPHRVLPQKVRWFNFPFTWNFLSGLFRVSRVLLTNMENTCICVCLKLCGSEVCVFAESLMMLENRVDAQLSSSAALFFSFPEAVTSARSPGTGALVPRTPPSSARDVTRAPLTSAAERATGQTRAHRRISKRGAGGGPQKQNQPQQTLRQRSRSPRCSRILCWKPAPVVLVDRSFQKATFSPTPHPPHTPPLFSSAPWGQ